MCFIVTLCLSNLSGTVRTVAVSERLPVSEIEHVKVELPANGHARLHLVFKVSTAPGVQSS